MKAAQVALAKQAQRGHHLALVQGAPPMTQAGRQHVAVALHLFAADMAVVFGLITLAVANGTGDHRLGFARQAQWPTTRR